MKPTSDSFLMHEEIEWQPAGEGIRRQILGYDEKMMMVKVAFEKGAVGYAHAHFHAQSTYVVSGVFEFTVDGKKKIVSEGDGLYIAPNITHGTSCLEAGTLIDVFSPLREDFLS
ncbi:MAG: cupin domain-containing protein [bacterium]|nr:cupin domain-containing protein [bacterium]MDD3968117.1 cupin domain-containing protein [Proteiniphilum sp.]MDD4435911.1 cupin domain-containing protein [Bacteroidales bacterium]NLO39310.1 cupin domain-containing protein [Ruminiclostridium sp.]